MIIPYVVHLGARHDTGPHVYASKNSVSANRPAFLEKGNGFAGHNRNNSSLGYTCRKKPAGSSCTTSKLSLGTYRLTELSHTAQYGRWFFVSNTGLSQEANIWKTLTNNRVEHAS